MHIIPSHLVSVVERAIEGVLADHKRGHYPDSFYTPQELQADPMAVLIVSAKQATLIADLMAGEGTMREPGSSVRTSAHGGSDSCDFATARITPPSSYVRPRGAT